MSVEEAGEDDDAELSLDSASLPYFCSRAFLLAFLALLSVAWVSFRKTKSNSSL